MEDFSELIKDKRLEKKYTMRGLEAALREKGVENISRSYINLLEKGRKRPTYEVAFALATILGIDPEKAITTAYRARIEHDKGRERKYLECFLSENGLERIDVEKVLKGR